MKDYASTYGYYIFALDLLIIIAMIWCVYRNGKSLFKPDYDQDDTDFRFTMFLMCLCFLIANIKAVERHSLTFFIEPIKLDAKSWEDLIWDRGFMLVSGYFKVLLTIKYKRRWFNTPIRPDQRNDGGKPPLTVV